MQEGQLLRALNQLNYLLWLGRRRLIPAISPADLKAGYQLRE